MTERRVPHTRIFDELVPQFGLVGAAVYGVVWRYAQMRDGHCHASYDRLASDIGITARTLSTHVGKLQEAGLLSVHSERGHTNRIDVTPERVSGVVTRTPERVSRVRRKEFPTTPERVSDKDTNKKPVKRPLKATPSRKRNKTPFWNDDQKVLADHFAEVSGLSIPKLEGRAFAAVTKSMKEGERYYGEFDVYAVDTVGTGADPIGEGKWYGVSTEPKGIGEWWESQTIHIFGRGVIEGVDMGPPWKGAIIGGTGEFAGASGEYSAGGGGAGFFRLTFTFQD